MAIFITIIKIIIVLLVIFIAIFLCILCALFDDEQEYLEHRNNGNKKEE